MNKQLEQEIKKQTQDSLGNEICGFIVFNLKSNKLEVIKCKNTIPKSNRFSLSAEDYLNAESIGQIIYAYHSHNSENGFSERDRVISEAHQIPFLLYSTVTDKFSEYFPVGYSNPYVGRKFQIKTSDCYTLFRDFYKKELEIDLPDFNRDEMWLTNPTDLFEVEMPKNGFIQVASPQKHDALLIKKFKNKPSSHVAIYLDNDLILHQTSNSYSRIDDYSDYYKERTTFIYRHESFL